MLIRKGIKIIFMIMLLGLFVTGRPESALASTKGYSLASASCSDAVSDGSQDKDTGWQTEKSEESEAAGMNGTVSISTPSDAQSKTVLNYVDVDYPEYIIMPGDSSTWETVQTELRELDFRARPEEISDVSEIIPLTIIEVDVSNVDIHTPGTYTVNIHLMLGEDYQEYYVLNDTLYSWSISCVQVKSGDEEITLSVEASLLSGMALKWTPAEDTDGLEVFYLTAEEAAFDEYDVIPNDLLWESFPETDVDVNGDQIILYWDEITIEAGTRFYVKIRQNGIESNVVRLDTLIRIADMTGGDKNNDDRNEQQMPTLSQPIPPAESLGNALGQEQNQTGSNNVISDSNSNSSDGSSSGSNSSSGSSAGENDSSTAAEFLPEISDNGSAENTAGKALYETQGRHFYGLLEPEPIYAADTALEDLTGQMTGVSGQSAASEQPTAQKKQEAAARPEALIEEVTDTKTVLSGKRLNKMLSISGDTISFEKNGVAVLIPSGYLTSLMLDDMDLLEVEILIAEDGFDFSLKINGESVAECPLMTAYVPCEQSDGWMHQLLKRKDGKIVRPSGYETEGGVISYLIDAGGHYRIYRETAADDTATDDTAAGGQEMPPPSEQQASFRILPEVGSGCVLLAVLIVAGVICICVNAVNGKTGKRND